jgi:Tfp pilus assembly protein PilV
MRRYNRTEASSLIQFSRSTVCRGCEPVHAARSRHGSTLIDVLLALVLLAIAGTALVVLLGQTSHSMHDAFESEHLARRASEQLAWLSTETRAELDARLGRTTLRGWTLDVRLASSMLFDVSIAVSDTSTPLLHTVFYRADTNASSK